MTDLENKYMLEYRPALDKYTMYSVYEPDKILETLNNLDDALQMMTSYIKKDALANGTYHDH